MKILFKSMIALLLIIGCNEAADHKIINESVADISDLSMTEDLQRVYSGRRQRLMEQTENGVAILRSDCEFDGGRHEWRAANSF